MGMTLACSYRAMPELLNSARDRFAESETVRTLALSALTAALALAFLALLVGDQARAATF